MANNNNQKTESDKKHDTSQDNKQTTDNKTKASASVPKKKLQNRCRSAHLIYPNWHWIEL